MEHLRHIVLLLSNISAHSLRRRFEQNQEDCTYTVIALLPTVREEIIGALPVEQITEQLQHERQERLRRHGASEAASSELPSGPPSVTDDGASLQSSSYVHASQMVSSAGDDSASSTRPKRSKAQLWQEMKIHSITRALTLMYTVALLTMLTRIQLNLLGRRTYLSSVVALASPPPAVEESTISLENRDDDNYDNMYGNDFETNRKYLTFSWWLLHRGSKQIMDRVMDAVKEVFGAVNIREDLSIERLSELVMQVRKKVEGATEEERRDMKWLSYLLPAREDEAFVIRQSTMSDDDVTSPEPRAVDDPMDASTVEASEVSQSLRRLLDETSDLIDSPTFTHVLSRLLDTSFSHLVDYHIAMEAFNASGLPAPGTSGVEQRVTEISDKKCKLAHLLPIFCKQAHVIAAGSGELEPMAEVAGQQQIRNEYVAAMDQVAELGAFAAVIYSSNFEYEIPDSQNTSASQSEQHQSPQIRASVPGSTAQVAEAEPENITSSTLRGNVVDIPSDTTGEGVAQSGLEAAWKRALADEDGRPATTS
jgi:peroxin-3